MDTHELIAPPLVENASHSASLNDFTFFDKAIALARAERGSSWPTTSAVPLEISCMPSEAAWVVEKNFPCKKRESAFFKNRFFDVLFVAGVALICLAFIIFVGSLTPP